MFKIGDSVTRNRHPSMQGGHKKGVTLRVTDSVQGAVQFAPDPTWYAEDAYDLCNAPSVIIKDTNPKDAIGSKKLRLSVVPDSLLIYAAMAFTEGDGKYGGFNYRVAGVRASIYMDAAKRHMAKWWNGEDCDPATKVPHLASAIACMGIILDAALVGKLVDDRPPKADIAKLIEQAEEVTAHLRELHKDCNPKQYTALNAE